MAQRELKLQRRLSTLKTLNEAISAMRSLAAHHFRLCRQALPAAREYRSQIDEAINVAQFQQPMNRQAASGILLLVSDIGLCGDYNTQLVEAFLELQHEKSAGPLYCVGHRPRGILRQHQIEPRKWYAAPTSVEALPLVLLEIAQDLIEDFWREKIGGLRVVSAQFQGAGRFEPIVTQVLPLKQNGTEKISGLYRYQSRERLSVVAMREYLYITLYELFLDALAAEHGMRLRAAESARQWLDEKSVGVQRQLAAAQREATTQELLDIVVGSRHARK